MTTIELVLKEEEARTRECFLYELLGKFGDRLPIDVQEEMKKEAKFESNTRKKLNKRIERQVQ